MYIGGGAYWAVSLRSETGMRKGRKGGREWKREGRNDRRLNIGKGRTGKKGKEREEKERDLLNL
jgi:hypothetical protein